MHKRTANSMHTKYATNDRYAAQMQQCIICASERIVVQGYMQ